MPASTKLCSAFLEFFTVLENKRFFNYAQSPKAFLSDLYAFAFKYPEYLKKAKHRSDIFINGLNIMQPVKKFRTQEQVLLFQEQSFSPNGGQVTNLHNFKARKWHILNMCAAGKVLCVYI